MKMADIRVITMTAGEIINWTSEAEALSCLPALKTTSCHWYTLQDDKIICSEKLHEYGTQHVVILHQDGWYTSPAEIMPLLSRYFLQAKNLQQPLWLVLTGGDERGSKRAWEEELSFVTHGRPPIFRLVVLALVLSVVCGYRRMIVGLNMLLRLVSGVK